MGKLRRQTDGRAPAECAAAGAAARGACSAVGKGGSGHCGSCRDRSGCGLIAWHSQGAERVSWEPGGYGLLAGLRFGVRVRVWG